MGAQEEKNEPKEDKTGRQDIGKEGMAMIQVGRKVVKRNGWT